ncbi:MAG: prephenate dehydrogenase [Bacteroidaceae bacterium]|nr:prephenate dehydrogenase [Bacteroidaceae bacterium]
MFDRKEKILIVGLGLIGGSYAQGFRRAGYYVGAVTRSQESIDYALENGLIDSGTNRPDREYISQFDLIVFSLYPKTLLSWIEENQSMIRPGALLTDVTGVKCSVVYDIQRMLRPDIEFIGAHPMAGREVYGVKNADADIFAGANYIVTPTPSNTEAAIEACSQVGRILGFSRIVRLSPEEHDEMIGFLSQLTHCIAIALMNSRETEHMAQYTGDSFRDLTRIARINDKMWSELFLMNKNALLKEMDLFIEQITRIRDAVQSDDLQQLQEMMRKSTERRISFDKK